MSPGIDLPRALLRGRYMCAVSAMEHAGVPIDVEMLQQFRRHWTDIQDELIRDIDVGYGYHVFEGRSFRENLFERWLVKNRIPWPRLESGRLELGDGAFRHAAKMYPAVAPLRELRSSLSDLRLNDLAVGADGRNRTLLSPFASKSSRNQPSNTKYIFGPSVWLRPLIKPSPGYGVAYIDYKQQEFGIAAALSGDVAMQAAYRSGDPYLEFAKQAGAVPHDATKGSHPHIRELFKACVLGTQYGQEAEGLAFKIDQSTIVARELLLQHHQTYRRCWAWTDAAVDTAMITNCLTTTYGWHVHVDRNPNPRSLRNFPMQGNGAEMLRIACCLGVERGVEIVAPVHDAAMIHAPLNRLDSDIAIMRASMAEASRLVLADFEIDTDVAVVRYPDRYSDPRGRVMWDRVTRLIAQYRDAEAAA